MYSPKCHGSSPLIQNSFFIAICSGLFFFTYFSHYFRAVSAQVYIAFAVAAAARGQHTERSRFGKGRGGREVSSGAKDVATAESYTVMRTRHAGIDLYRRLFRGARVPPPSRRPAVPPVVVGVVTVRRVDDDDHHHRRCRRRRYYSPPGSLLPDQGKPKCSAIFIGSWRLH